MNKEEKIYIGIDVSKPILDVTILPNKKYMQFKNDLAGIERLIKKIKKFPNALIVMESTGGYEKLLAINLLQADHKACIMNPRRIRDFAKSMGILAKTDKIDSGVIALFASKIEPDPNFDYDEETNLLSENNARRRQLIGLITMEKNRLDKASPKHIKGIERVIKFLTKELSKVNIEQQKLLESNADFAEKADLLTSVKGIGDLTARALLAELPELGLLGSKQIASLAGLAPFNRDSGKFKGLRTIWGGRATVRCALYMATLVATRHNTVIRSFYHRLLAAGKKKKVALTACMHKLLIIINAMIKNKTFWREPTPLQT
jgi:transposase